ALAVISVVAPGHAATAIAGEREGKTYESLLLTGMDPRRIVWGKFLGSYASIALVLVAFSPIVGIAFLFGGVSPSYVLWGFYALLLVLAPAVALGIAISARVASVRIAILISTSIYPPAAFFGTILIAGLGELADSAWDVQLDGPFWFTEALSERFFEPDTFALLGLLPLLSLGMATWFLLASAVAGIRPAAEDRSTPFKIWALVATLVVAPFVAIFAALDPSDSEEIGLAFTLGGAPLLLHYALLFINEPPLPPRRKDLEPRFPLLFKLLGAGAAPTTRFGLLLIALTSILLAISAAAGRYLSNPGFLDHAKWDAALLIAALGQACVGMFLLSLGALLRTLLRNGAATRALVLAFALASIVLPFVLAAILEPRGLFDWGQEIPAPMLLSPILPGIVAVMVADHGISRAAPIVSTFVIYGLGSLALWALVEVRVREIRRSFEAARAAHDASMAASAPAPSEAPSPAPSEAPSPLDPPLDSPPAPPLDPRAEAPAEAPPPAPGEPSEAPERGGA
ncbi:MAG: hypothetical protein OEY14_04020, partial [Myxococcales bacterium]|nr:hypothetical protein [Myxococcales bacterium]